MYAWHILNSVYKLYGMHGMCHIINDECDFNRGARTFLICARTELDTRYTVYHSMTWMRNEQVSFDK